MFVFWGDGSDLAKQLVESIRVRSTENFNWTFIFILAVVFYVYWTEIHKKNYEIVYAGLALYGVHWLYEICNAVIAHVFGYPLWSVSNQSTTFILLIGVCWELSMMFSLAGIISFKMLPQDRNKRYFSKDGKGGISCRFAGALSMALLFALFESFLAGTSNHSFIWVYKWWGVIPVFITTYVPFFLASNYVPDMKPKARKTFLVTVWGLVVVLLVVLIPLGIIRQRMAFDLYIKTKQDLLDAVAEYGIVPYFRNSLPGFSIEEHVDPKAWFFEDLEGVWEWKGPVIRESGCAYGKFFEKKAAFVSREWFMDLASFRRDGYDYEGFFNDGWGTYKDKALYDLIEARGPVLSKELKRLGSYRKGGATGFDTSICRLQHQCFVVISDFRYMKDKHGNEYGWGVAEYATAEQQMGEGFSAIYSRDPKESKARVLDHLRSIFPDAAAEAVERFLSR